MNMVTTGETMHSHPKEAMAYSLWHNKLTALTMEGQHALAWKLFLTIPDSFANDPLYIDDKLALYCQNLGASAAYDLLRTLPESAEDSCTRLEIKTYIYTKLKKRKELEGCLLALHQRFSKAKAAYLLGILRLMDKKPTAAAYYFSSILEQAPDSVFYYYSLTLIPLCMWLRKEADWERAARMAALTLDGKAAADPDYFWLRQLSCGLWELLGEKDAVAANQSFIDAILRLANDPEAFYAVVEEK